jgi:fibro-slime domain-containing protein
MRNLARFSLLALLLGGFSGTGCGPGSTNGTGVGDDNGGNSGNSGFSGTSGAANGAGVGGTIVVNNCGNSIINDGETCDDGNRIGGDGCSSDCKTEPGSVCDVPGQMCTAGAAVCGNGVVSRTEACDEGMTPTPGCVNCTTVAPGWQCRVPGKQCVPLCGDSVLTGTENCDPPRVGMGCSATCLVEPGWTCTPAGCAQSVCGNGMVESGESCDDGTNPASGKLNGLFTGDPMETLRGCSKTCTKEPACRDATGTHACAAVCGDGNVDMGELCDDGNAVNGDGCSAMCMREAGFTCTDMARPDTEPCTLSGAAACLRMPVTYRDFDGQNLASGHPDFFFLGSTPAGGTKVTCVPNATGRPVGTNGSCWDSDSTPLCTGIAAAALGPNGKPALGATMTCPCRFTDWDNSGIIQAGGAGVTQCNDAGGNPRQRIETTSRVVTSAQSFAQWYTDSALGTKVVGLLELGVLGTGGYQFSSSNGRTVYEDLHDVFMRTAIPARTGQSPIFADAAANTLSSGFFPLEAQTGAHAGKMCNLWPYWPAALTTANCVAQDGNPVWQQWDPQGSGQMGVAGTGGRIVPVTGVPRNFYFTSEVRYLFKYAGNEVLSFYGDDDVWVFINGKLVLDLGAPHERLQGTVTLAGGSAAYTIQTQTFVAGVSTPMMIGMGTVPNLGLEVGRTYEIVVFHADRHPRESNYQLSLSGFSTTRTTCTPRCGDAVRTGGEECDCGDPGTMAPGECGGLNNADGVYGGCTGMCKYGPFCGDGTHDAQYEECDNGNMNGANYGAKGACTAACKLAPFCGDVIVDPPYEECDKGEAVNGTMGADCDAQCQKIIL